MTGWIEDEYVYGGDPDLEEERMLERQMEEDFPCTNGPTCDTPNCPVHEMEDEEAGDFESLIQTVVGIDLRYTE